MAEQESQYHQRRAATGGSSRARRAQAKWFPAHDKTIVVATVTRVPHPKFGKIVKQMRNFMRTTNRTRRSPATLFASWKAPIKYS